MQPSERLLRERRQVALMRSQLEGFVAGSVPLPRLITDLEGLLNALEVLPDEWRDEFRSAWGGLEISYAVALDRLTPIPDASDSGVADDLFELRVLIDRADRLLS